MREKIIIELFALNNSETQKMIENSITNKNPKINLMVKISHIRISKKDLLFLFVAISFGLFKLKPQLLKTEIKDTIEKHRDTKPNASVPILLNKNGVINNVKKTFIN